MFKKNQKGFTLIELLIVVAIIAILAAIAIPQFSAYRVRGFNAAASSDVRNLATAQEALFTDTQGYGAPLAGANLAPSAGPAPAALALFTGPLTPAQRAPAVPIATWVEIQNQLGAIGFSMSNNVGGVSGGSGNNATGGLTDYAVVTKNAAGDTCYGRDSDSTSMYRITGQLGVALTVAGGQVPTLNVDDFNGKAGAGECNIAGSLWAAI